MEGIIEIVKNLLFIFNIYSIFCGIIFIISLWKIFKKENIPPYYSLIPFYNLYKYFKICNLPFWIIFIPVVNVISLYCSTYVITKKYRCKRWQSVLSVFFPWIFMPYIAFSEKRNIDFVVDDCYVKNVNDIDALEKRLENDLTDIEYEFKNSKVDRDRTNVEESKDNNFIDNVESNILSDEYVFDDVEEIKEKDVVLPSADDFDNNEFIELNDDFDINNISLENVDKLEEKIATDNSVEKKIETTIKEYENVAPTKESIAFGGKDKNENVDSVQTKNDELKCSRCGSSLVGANGFCPGCGMKI